MHLNAFCPESGDVDILIVVKKSLDIATKLAIAEDIMKVDQEPCPLEMAAILLEDAKAWRTPGNCVFHYSDFWNAISEDIDEYDFHAYNPRYFASNVLILGRILSFKKETRILSKYESGLWMIDYVPEELKYLPELAKGLKSFLYRKNIGKAGDG